MVRSLQELLLAEAPRNEAGCGPPVQQGRPTSQLCSLLTASPVRPLNRAGSNLGGIPCLFPAWLFIEMEGQRERKERKTEGWVIITKCYIVGTGTEII